MASNCSSPCFFHHTLNVRKKNASSLKKIFDEAVNIVILLTLEPKEHIFLIFYMMKWEEYIKYFCCILKHHGCLTKKHLCDFVSQELNKSLLFFHEIPLKKELTNYGYSDSGI